MDRDRAPCNKLMKFFFFQKNSDRFRQMMSQYELSGTNLFNEHKETCNCGRENSHISDILLSNCSGQYKNQQISES